MYMNRQPHDVPGPNLTPGPPPGPNHIVGPAPQQFGLAQSQACLRRFLFLKIDASFLETSDIPKGSTTGE